MATVEIPPLPHTDEVRPASTPASSVRSKRLADLLLEVARCVDQDVAAVLPKPPAGDPRMEALRSVLLEKEQNALARLQDKFDDPRQFADAVSKVLVEALSLANSRDDELGKLLAPTLERAAQASIRKDPNTLVGIVYPLIGPAIRKSIAETLDTTLKNLNQAFKHSFSWQGLRWRLEAFRTGSTFADVVLRHTVAYRVEHVFLVHRKTGLLLEHVAAPEAEGQDPQLVSGMLTAIQDFVRDSFSSGKGGSAIDSLRLGDLLLWCEEGPFAYIAAVIRGTPPDSLHTELRETLRRIHEDLRVPLEEFQGDTTSLSNLAEPLTDCLKQRELPRETKLSPWLWAVPLALLLIAGFFVVRRGLEGRRVDAYVQHLRGEPGIVVTEAGRRGGKWYVAGLRDPLAIDPASILGEAGLDAGLVAGHWQAYQALDPEMVLKRLTATLAPPRGVTFAMKDGAILAQGSAPQHWVERARTLIAALPAGAAAVDLSAITDIQDPTFVGPRDAIQSRVIRFAPNAPRPAQGQDADLDALAADIRELKGVAGELGFSVRVMIVGHTDSTGTEMANLTLSAARAEVTRSMLRDRGIAPELLLVRSTGNLEPVIAEQENTALNRSVTFTVSTVD